MGDRLVTYNSHSLKRLTQTACMNILRQPTQEVVLEILRQKHKASQTNGHFDTLTTSTSMENLDTNAGASLKDWSSKDSDYQSSESLVDHDPALSVVDINNDKYPDQSNENVDQEVHHNEVFASSQVRLSYQRSFRSQGERPDVDQHDLGNTAPLENSPSHTISTSENYYTNVLVHHAEVYSEEGHRQGHQTPSDTVELQGQSVTSDRSNLSVSKSPSPPPLPLTPAPLGSPAPPVSSSAEEFIEGTSTVAVSQESSNVTGPGEESDQETSWSDSGNPPPLPAGPPPSFPPPSIPLGFGDSTDEELDDFLDNDTTEEIDSFMQPSKVEFAEKVNSAERSVGVGVHEGRPEVLLSLQRVTHPSVPIPSSSAPLHPSPTPPPSSSKLDAPNPTVFPASVPDHTLTEQEALPEPLKDSSALHALGVPGSFTDNIDLSNFSHLLPPPVSLPQEPKAIGEEPKWEAIEGPSNTHHQPLDDLPGQGLTPQSHSDTSPGAKDKHVTDIDTLLGDDFVSKDQIVPNSKSLQGPLTKDDGVTLNKLPMLPQRYESYGTHGQGQTVSNIYPTSHVQEEAFSIQSEIEAPNNLVSHGDVYTDVVNVLPFITREDNTHTGPSKVDPVQSLSTGQNTRVHLFGEELDQQSHLTPLQTYPDHMTEESSAFLWQHEVKGASTGSSEVSQAYPVCISQTLAPTTSPPEPPSDASSGVQASQTSNRLPREQVHEWQPVPGMSLHATDPKRNVDNEHNDMASERTELFEGPAGSVENSTHNVTPAINTRPPREPIPATQSETPDECEPLTDNSANAKNVVSDQYHLELQPRSKDNDGNTRDDQNGASSVQVDLDEGIRVPPPLVPATPLGSGTGNGLTPADIDLVTTEGVYDSIEVNTHVEATRQVNTPAETTCDIPATEGVPLPLDVISASSVLLEDGMSGEDKISHNGDALLHTPMVSVVGDEAFDSVNAEAFGVAAREWQEKREGAAVVSQFPYTRLSNEEQISYKAVEPTDSKLNLPDTESNTAYTGLNIDSDNPPVEGVSNVTITMESESSPSKVSALDTGTSDGPLLRWSTLEGIRSLLGKEDLTPAEDSINVLVHKSAPALPNKPFPMQPEHNVLVESLPVGCKPESSRMEAEPSNVTTDIVNHVKERIEKNDISGTSSVEIQDIESVHQLRAKRPPSPLLSPLKPLPTINPVTSVSINNSLQQPQLEVSTGISQQEQHSPQRKLTGEETITVRTSPKKIKSGSDAISAPTSPRKLPTLKTPTPFQLAPLSPLRSSTSLLKSVKLKSKRSETEPFQVEVLKGLLGVGFNVDVTPEGHVKVKAIHPTGPLARNENIK